MINRHPELKYRAGSSTEWYTCWSAPLLLYSTSLISSLCSDRGAFCIRFCVLCHHRGLSGFREDSWFKSLFVRKVDPRKDAHSHLLAKKEDSNLYKIQCMCCFGFVPITLKEITSTVCFFFVFKMNLKMFLFQKTFV